jgi:tRNA uridine 5-carboxymethylaminomethyl modification enzyme
MRYQHYAVVVIGGGHAGVEAAWAAGNVLRAMRARGLREKPSDAAGDVLLVSLDPAKIGVMSCNPANGGLAKGQLVREVDALHGLMGLATDSSGIHFRVLNDSRGPAVRGPRAQCDKHAYAENVKQMIAAHDGIDVAAGSCERLIVEQGRLAGVQIARGDGAAVCVSCERLVLTTGTFMRGLMHTGEQKTEGGRFGEGAAKGISQHLRELGFELGRLKTGTPPRLKRGTIDWEQLPAQHGDDKPLAFSDLSAHSLETFSGEEAFASTVRFAVLPQVECRVTQTGRAIHEVIRGNLHRAPMYSGQIESMGPRYCPSLEDKIVRFADKESHQVFLEPESLRDDWVYCNGISTSLPRDVQDVIVRNLPGCERAEIYRYGYAVEYDMVMPHQLLATGETKRVRGLFLAGQINGTSGYEEAAGQGVVAGMNAARSACGQESVAIGRHQAFIGVLMDDLATKTPVEPYRMFTSRAEHRLMLRAENSADRLHAFAEEMGLLGDDSTADAAGRLSNERRRRFAVRRERMMRLKAFAESAWLGGKKLEEILRRPEQTVAGFAEVLRACGGQRVLEAIAGDSRVLESVMTEAFYEPFASKAKRDVARMMEMEKRKIPADFDYSLMESFRGEARGALMKFRPATLGQAQRLEGMTPADVMLLSVLIRKHAAV